MYRMKKTLLLMGVGLAFLGQAAAQQRYVDKVFTSVNRTTSVVYGRNITVLPALVPNQLPEAQDLKMDIYEPAGDTATKRPLILIAHSGNFLPAILNRSPYGGSFPPLPLATAGPGGSRDSAVVALATEFAKRGYVVAAFNYRLGWSASSTDVNTQRRTILQAAFRATQDARTCARFFRKDVATNSNSYKIDSSKIIIGGIGTGGYVALNSAYLNSSAELQLLKFVDQTTTPPQPYVFPPAWGGLASEDTAAVNFPGTTVPLALGNHKGYSSKFNVAFQLGGALGDTSWMDAGEIPMIGLQSIRDPFAPYKVGDVIVPTTGITVIPQASGSFTNVEKAVAFGNNAALGTGYTDPYSVAANSKNGGKEGLFPFDMPAPPATIQCKPAPANPTPGYDNSGPWNWFSEPVYGGSWNAYYQATPNANELTGPEAICVEKQGNPNNKANAMTYIDTAVSYICPRIAKACNLTTGIDRAELLSSISLYPNPAQTAVTVRSLNAANPVTTLRVYDMTGRLVREISDLRADTAVIERANLETGMYMVRISFAKGELTQRIIFE